MSVVCVQAIELHAPESATMSVVVSPFLAKPLMRLARLEPGGGRSLLACERLAVVESLLPNSTVYGGPPNCKQRKEAEYINIILSPASVSAACLV